MENEVICLVLLLVMDACRLLTQEDELQAVKLLTCLIMKVVCLKYICTASVETIDESLKQPINGLQVNKHLNYV